MMVSSKVVLDFGGASGVEIDLSRVKMTADQKNIVMKLLGSLRPEDRIDLAKEDKCEEGKCVSSRYLPANEFAQIRGLKASIGTDATLAGLICDFCLHCVTLPQ